MKILLVTDAWAPQINGVVRTLQRVRQEVEALGHAMEVIAPDRFKTIPCPTYPEIKLAINARGRMAALIEAFDPDAIHIATEGPLGWSARRYCLRRNLPFTTAYHTKFPEYIHARIHLPLSVSYAVMRRFHGRSSGVMVATETIAQELRERRFKNIRRWTRGVDLDLFHPSRRDKSLLDGPRPIMLYTGRVAVEKNIEAFLELEHEGTKVVVGDGPALPELQRRFPEVHFAGMRHGEDLARYYASADVFCFPSLTDTFGLVMIEALASGTPVAAYPVPGPLDVIADGAGVLDENLGRAIDRALKIDRDVARRYAMNFSWAACANLFLQNLHPFKGEKVAPSPAKKAPSAAKVSA